MEGIVTCNNLEIRYKLSQLQAGGAKYMPQVEYWFFKIFEIG